MIPKIGYGKKFCTVAVKYCCVAGPWYVAEYVGCSSRPRRPTGGTCFGRNGVLIVFDG